MKLKDAARPHLAWAIEVAWNLGVRTGESELLALTWNDIDWDDSSIKVDATKTKTIRVLPMAPNFWIRRPWPLTTHPLNPKRFGERTMNTFWVFAHSDGDSIKHYRQFESSACPYSATARQAGGTKAAGGKSTITGKRFRTSSDENAQRLRQLSWQVRRPRFLTPEKNPSRPVCWKASRRHRA